MPNSKPIKILLADDHKLFRSGLIKILKGYTKFNVVGEAEDGYRLVSEYLHLNPDIILVDISMPKLSGIDAVKKIKELNPAEKVLFLSMYDSEEYVYSCLIAGGSGLVNKNIMEDELIKAITKVANGEKYFGNNYTEEKLSKLRLSYQSVHQKSSLKDTGTLTKREKEILKLIGDGFTNSEIADKINISVRTVETHRSHIIKKLDIKSLTELIRFAIEFSIE